MRVCVCACVSAALPMKLRLSAIYNPLCDLALPLVKLPVTVSVAMAAASVSGVAEGVLALRRDRLDPGHGATPGLHDEPRHAPQDAARPAHPGGEEQVRGQGGGSGGSRVGKDCLSKGQSSSGSLSPSSAVSGQTPEFAPHAVSNCTCQKKSWRL